MLGKQFCHSPTTTKVKGDGGPNRSPHSQKRQTFNLADLCEITKSIFKSAVDIFNCVRVAGHKLAFGQTTMERDAPANQRGLIHRKKRWFRQL
jgi:hypothetical protein